VHPGEESKSQLVEENKELKDSKENEGRYQN
jgi:hypothetical protein